MTQSPNLGPIEAYLKGMQQRATQLQQNAESLNHERQILQLIASLAGKIEEIKAQKPDDMRTVLLLQKVLTELTPSLKGPQGEPGYTPIKGIDYFDGVNGYTPQKNIDYFDGATGATGPQGENGQDGNANLKEVSAIAKAAVKKHEKDFSHALLHESTKVGPYEIDVASLNDGELLQVKGDKIVGVTLPKQKVQQLLGGAGTSSVRSFPVTQSIELDAMGIYIVDATAGNITVTVPSAVGRENSWFELIRIDASTNTVTVVPTSSETFSGMTDYSMQQWTCLKLFAYSSSYLMRSA